MVRREEEEKTREDCAMRTVSAMVIEEQNGRGEKRLGNEMSK
jgi:hypothetical protein